VVDRSGVTRNAYGDNVAVRYLLGGGMVEANLEGTMGEGWGLEPRVGREEEVGPGRREEEWGRESDRCAGFVWGELIRDVFLILFETSFWILMCVNLLVD